MVVLNYGLDLFVIFTIFEARTTPSPTV